ncbi:MAG: sigma-70 family RNA polymerase sigma factor [Myxococcales bacterium]|nr:sigma-70 family RNA polymerase sigma factor [Myxococcales bacterium]MDH5306954.1 sigma-70 family RNA polymerase sigma factor [Myxococcales bacterium]MDH5566052.1 sigma-70 family RNA polymerase sigma factor [Myxococcales bacterium]
MRRIQRTPLLDREQTRALAHAMRREQHIFERALFALPGTARLLLERWEARRRAGHVTAALSRHYRDGSGRDCNRSMDACFRELEALLDREPFPRAQVAALLARAELAFELLCEIHADLRARAAESREERARLGIACNRGEQQLTRAGRAYARYEAFVSTFARHNLRLVVKCAHRFQGSGMPLMDLIQEGNLGLLRAIEKFDPDRGFAFSTYAVWWIQQTMIRAIQNQRRTVRVPSHVCEQQMRYRSVCAELTRRLGREPALDELGKALVLSVEQVEALEATLAPVRSIHAPLQACESVALEDVLPDEQREDPDEQLGRERLRDAVAGLLSTLDTRERIVISWRYGFGDGDEPLTLSEIGRRLGISRERARQIEYSALCRLRHRVGVDKLRDCLESARG